MPHGMPPEDTALWCDGVQVTESTRKGMSRAILSLHYWEGSVSSIQLKINKRGTWSSNVPVTDSNHTYQKKNKEQKNSSTTRNIQKLTLKNTFTVSPSKLKDISWGVKREKITLNSCEGKCIKSLRCNENLNIFRFNHFKHVTNEICNRTGYQGQLQ